MKPKLTPRQWHLYDFLKESNGFDTQLQLLVAYENELANGLKNLNLTYEQQEENIAKYSFNYYEEIIERMNNNNEVSFSDLSSSRRLRYDIKALRNDDTIQKIIITNKVADTVEETKAYLDKKLIRALKILKEYHIEKKKLERHLQTRIVLNSERDVVIAVKGLSNEWAR